MNIKNQIKNFEDAIIDNIINTSDEEILEEVKEDYGNENYIANKMRNIIKNVKFKLSKE